MYNDNYLQLGSTSVVVKLFNPLTATIGRLFFGQKLPATRAKELFKPFTDSASLLVEIEKNVFRFWFGVF